GVHRGKEPSAREACAQPAEGRHERQHRGERAGEQPLQLFGAGLDRQRVAHRPQEIVAAKQQEEVGEGPRQRAQLVRLGAQRAAAAPGDAAAMQGLAQAEGVLGGALGRLLAVVEAYPDLKANQNVLGLQEELTSTENRVAFARQAYNDSVMEYNTRRESFPDNLLAGAFGF